MKRLAFLPLILGTAALAYACSSAPARTTFEEDGGSITPGADAGDGTEDAGPKFEFDGNLPDAAQGVDECRKMDIIFVVDDSGSMGGAQAKLKANFPRMINTLNAFKTKAGTDLDYRLAVTSTDVVTASRPVERGARGGFVTQVTTGCQPGGAPGRSWLERTDGDVPGFFGCRAALGTSGSGNEKPLDGLVMSFTDRLADQNKNFIREDALLAFFMLTDEEDSSTNTPDQTIQKLDLLKKVRGRWAGAVISGPKAAECSTTGHTADPAPKLHRLVEGAADTATGKNNVIWRTICQENYDTAVTDALNTFTVACQNLPPLPK